MSERVLPDEYIEVNLNGTLSSASRELWDASIGEHRPSSSRDIFLGTEEEVMNWTLGIVQKDHLPYRIGQVWANPDLLITLTGKVLNPYSK